MKIQPINTAVLRDEFENCILLLDDENCNTPVSRFYKLKFDFQVVNKNMFESRNNET